MQLTRKEKMTWRLNAFFRSLTMKRVDKGVFISPSVEIPTGRKISLGEKTRVGPYCRLEATSPESVIEVGKNVWLQRNVTAISYDGSIKIGNNVSMQPFGVLWGPGDIEIGNDVRMGPRVSIIAGNHNFSETEKIIRSQGMTSIGISVQDDCWLGAHSVILDGVTIAKGCVVAAGAVVTKSTEPYGIYAGVPAKKIRSRKPVDA